VYSLMIMQEKNQKMSLKQIQNSTLFGEIQTPTVTFIAYLTRFRLITHQFKNPHRIPTGPWGFITVPIPIPYPYPWQPCGFVSDSWTFL